jgi:hypothetical protein
VIIVFTPSGRANVSARVVMIVFTLSGRANVSARIVVIGFTPKGRSIERPYDESLDFMAPHRLHCIQRYSLHITAGAFNGTPPRRDALDFMAHRCFHRIQ